MEITFNISQSNLKELKAQFEQDLAVLVQSAADIRENIARIDKALNPIKAMDIPSESGWGTTYKVTKQQAFPFYTCTCASFKYGAGLDLNGYCKHIRRAQGRGL